MDQISAIAKHPNLPWHIDFIIPTVDISLMSRLDIEHYPNKSDRFLVRTAFLEIYNEKISDLMVGIIYIQEKEQN